MPRKCPCGTRSYFNVFGETKGICCKRCKTDDMIDVVNKRCSCGTLSPVFNVPGRPKGICCSKCKTDGMIDVVHKVCSCGNRPMFNMVGETVGVCCKICKTDEMIDVVNKKCSCGKQPHFNVPGETVGICCAKCKTDEMTDVVHKICPGHITECPVRTYVSNGREYCMVCDPDDARRKLYRRFEEAFFDYVKDKIDLRQRNFTVKYDQRETSKKHAFIDGIVMRGCAIVCLEVDEDGHRYYECDEHRMHLATAELLQMYPGHTVSWVRVNPTVQAKNQWSEPSRNTREKRFEEVVTIVNDILETRDTRVVYIGFDDM